MGAHNHKYHLQNTQQYSEITAEMVTILPHTGATTHELRPPTGVFVSVTYSTNKLLYNYSVCVRCSVTRSEISCIYAGNEIAIIKTALSPVTEITQNHKGYDVPCLTSSCLENLSVPPDTYACRLLIIDLPSYSTEVL